MLKEPHRTVIICAYTLLVSVAGWLPADLDQSFLSGPDLTKNIRIWIQKTGVLYRYFLVIGQFLTLSIDNMKEKTWNCFPFLCFTFCLLKFTLFFSPFLLNYLTLFWHYLRWINFFKYWEICWWCLRSPWGKKWEQPGTVLWIRIQPDLVILLWPGYGF